MNNKLRITSTDPLNQRDDLLTDNLKHNHDLGKDGHTVLIDAEKHGMLEFDVRGNEIEKKPFKAHASSLPDLAEYFAQFPIGHSELKSR